jgi:small subunit ribosomal protein S18
MFKIVRSLDFAAKRNVDSILSSNTNRSFSFSAVQNLKKIEKTVSKDKKTIVIEGKYLNPEQEFGNKVLNLCESRTSNLIAQSDSSTCLPCSWCQLEKKGIQVQYTDILVLRQFLKEDGDVLQRKITGLCKKQQRKLLVLVKHARQAGLILNLQPKLIDGGEPDTNPRNRPEHLKWNSYFDKYEIMMRKQKYL